MKLNLFMTAENSFLGIIKHFYFAPSNNSKLTLIAGRPRSGKTTHLIKTLFKNRKHVQFVFLAEESSKIFLQKYEKQIGKPLTMQSTYIYDEPLIKVESIQNTLQNYFTKNDKVSNRQNTFIYVDYLQLLKTDQIHNSRVEEMNYILRFLKKLAEQFNVNFIVTAQLNRKPESRKNLLHTPNDLREISEHEVVDQWILLEKK